MKSVIKSLVALVLGAGLLVAVSCNDDEGEDCSGCPDDAPYGAIGGDCYATQNECEASETGNCTICQ